ncbi:MAG: AMP-binding protein [Proteobacteria bacterium]|nr:AMP-binding protein [Pseudomonadota bacterium]MDA1058823.1 AMP-binding protein [Pseudomonadota bacterium]
MAVAEEIDIIAERAPDILTLPRLLRRHARTRPNAPALRQKRFGIWSEMSWSQYERAASHFAQGIIGLGYGRGDHLAILSENRREWVIAELGMHLAGAVAAGVYATSPAAEILHVLNLTEAKAIICEDQEQVDKVLEIRDQLPQLRHIIYFDGKGLAGYDRADLIAYDDLIDAGAKASQRDPGFLDRAMADHDPDDVALIVCTSGSTGPPKAALITFRNIAFVGEASARNIGQTRGDSAVSYLPLCHVAEQLFSVFLAMHAGYVVSFGESLRTVQSDLREIAPTIFLGVPRIWEKMRGDVLIRARSAGLIQGLVLRAALRDSRRFDDPWKTNYGLGDRLRHAVWEWLAYRPLRNALGLTRCRIAISGAAPVALETLRFLRGLGVPLMEGFGMTETAGACAIQHRDRRFEGRIGVPLDGIEMKTAPDGELLIRGGCVFAGYYRNDEETREALQDGWLHTGDIAEVFPDGSVSIIDRKKDIAITAGGKNLTPSLIENAVKASPYIKECVVVADGRRFVTALIQIDFDMIANWADGEGVAYTTFRSLVENPQVAAIVQREVDSANAQLANVERIKKFHLLAKELDHDDGEVTATMKIRRAKITEAYEREIAALYA